jgi:hypothetical protein
MTFAERIDGPLGPTTGSPPRLCWQVPEATLAGPRITASLAMPVIDWIRVDSNGIRRQDQRTQFLEVKRRFLPGLKAGVSTPRS